MAMRDYYFNELPGEYDTPQTRRHVAKQFSIRQSVVMPTMFELHRHLPDGKSLAVGTGSYGQMKELRQREESEKGHQVRLNPGVKPEVFYRSTTVAEDRQQSEPQLQRVQRFYVKQSEDSFRTWDVWERRANGQPDYLKGRYQERNSAIQSREGLESFYGRWLDRPVSSTQESTSQSEQTETSNPRRSLQMNHSLAVFLVAPDKVRAVSCAYELDDKGKPKGTYTFKTVLSDLAPGDIVIVPTDTRVKFTCVQVVETEVELDLNSTIDYKWIVAKLDRTEYDKVLGMERSMIDKIKRSEVRKARKAVADALFEDQEELRLQLEAEAKVIGHEIGPSAQNDQAPETPKA